MRQGCWRWRLWYDGLLGFKWWSHGRLRGSTPRDRPSRTFAHGVNVRTDSHSVSWPLLEGWAEPPVGRTPPSRKLSYQQLIELRQRLARDEDFASAVRRVALL